MLAKITVAGQFQEGIYVTMITSDLLDNEPQTLIDRNGGSIVRPAGP